MLHGAATRGSAKVLQLLLDAAALVDAKDVCGALVTQEPLWATILATKARFVDLELVRRR